jgi:hypothetical protein
MVTHEPTERLPLGQVVITVPALAACLVAGLWPHELLDRHRQGDWGELCLEDRRANRVALSCGYRVLSVYELPTGIRVWCLTEADRSVTTVLLPEEY